jgi:hypothetical protein
MPEFEGSDFAHLKALREDRYFQSTTKQNAIKIDSVFITFNTNDKS